MKRPPPRTLAAQPPPLVRVPTATAYEGRFPALQVLLASGIVLPACAAPVCGETRADEVETHGRASMHAASDGEASRALRELGIALGVVTHPAATTVPDNGMHTAGVPVPVEHTMPVVTSPPVVTTPPATPTDVDGAIRPVGPTPPTPTTPGGHTTTPRVRQPVGHPTQPVPLGGTPPPTTPTPPQRPPTPPTTPTPPRTPDIITAGEPMAVSPLPPTSPRSS